jgi:hypothetical protein
VGSCYFHKTFFSEEGIVDMRAGIFFPSDNIFFPSDNIFVAIFDNMADLDGIFLF